MSTDPSEAIQRAVLAALRGDEVIRSLLGNPPRVYDDVPPDAKFPYVTIGDDDWNDFSDGCHDLTETFVNVRVWSREVGKVKVKPIMKAVRTVLDRDIDSPISVEGHSIRTHGFRNSRVVPGPDGRTTQGIVTVWFITEPV